MQNFEGIRGTMTKFGNKEHRKTNLRFLGPGEQANLFQGTRGLVPLWEGLSNGSNLYNENQNPVLS